MVWQDYAISGATVLIIISLINQVYYDFKHKVGSTTLLTSSMYVTALTTITFALYTLGLFVSTILMSTNTSLWIVLFFQRLKYGAQ